MPSRQKLGLGIAKCASSGHLQHHTISYLDLYPPFHHQTSLSPLTRNFPVYNLISRASPLLNSPQTPDTMERLSRMLAAAQSMGGMGSGPAQVCQFSSTAFLAFVLLKFPHHVFRHVLHPPKAYDYVNHQYCLHYFPNSISITMPKI